MMIERRATGVAFALAIAIAGGCASEADEQALRATVADRPPAEDAAAAVEDEDGRPTPRDPVTTTTDPPTTTTTAPLPPGFDSGPRVVGTDVQPGRYVSEEPFCYWERRSGLSGTFEEIIVNGGGEGHTIVDILPGDAAFDSTGCGRWSLYQTPTTPPLTEFGAGDWTVGEEIVPGTYQADGGMCAWERATGFTHDYDEILDYGFPMDEAVVVEIRATDVRFTSTGCGQWTPA